MALFLLIAVFLLIIGLEFPPLIRGKRWRDLIAVSAFLLVGMGLSFSLALGITPSDPNRPLEIIFKPLVEWLMATSNGGGS
jgi:hypothetical protein